ncbi:MAG: hypothetical protein HFH82_12775 [Lachnospiraceae bacterium]|nr:hypothetical protein [Lachnospiraceae bacterium]
MKRSSHYNWAIKKLKAHIKNCKGKLTITCPRHSIGDCLGHFVDKHMPSMGWMWIMQHQEIPE